MASPCTFGEFSACFKRFVGSSRVNPASLSRQHKLMSQYLGILSRKHHCNHFQRPPSFLPIAAYSYSHGLLIRSEIRLNAIYQPTRAFKRMQTAKESATVKDILKKVKKSKSEDGLTNLLEDFLKAQKAENSKLAVFWKYLSRGTLVVLLIYISLVLVRTLREGDLIYLPIESTQSDTKFTECKGVDEAIDELKSVVDYLKNPTKYTAIGAKLPKGILLTGPPGTGKTLLARATAGEANVPFFASNGSDFDHMFVGSGARTMKKLFSSAKLIAPSLVFIDELDSVGGKRTTSTLHPYANQTVNQLLAEMDGFTQNQGVVVIGATNFPEKLDQALKRPGRFDLEVEVQIPDFSGRFAILNLYLSKVKYDKAIDVEALARGTPGFTGADLENLINQAALKAAKDSSQVITAKHLEHAKDRILMGLERKSAIADQDSREQTAYHEAGHSLVLYYNKHSDKLHKATIMPRGHSLGHTAYLPPKDEWNLTRARLLAKIDCCMGGRVAEELIFGKDNVTTGIIEDLREATKIATKMVMHFGMSDQVGIMSYTDESSPDTKSKIETEVQSILKDSYERASEVLKQHSQELDLLAKALLRYETLNADDIKYIIQKKTINLDKCRV